MRLVTKQPKELYEAARALLERAEQEGFRLHVHPVHIAEATFVLRKVYGYARERVAHDLITLPFRRALISGRHFLFHGQHLPTSACTDGIAFSQLSPAWGTGRLPAPLGRGPNRLFTRWRLYTVNLANRAHSARYAGYQKCALMQELAQRLGIELLYLPAYSPNLNLIERLWKWVKKKCLYSKYYATSEDFQQAIQECIAQAHSKHQAELKGLLTLEFQTFKEVPVIGEGGKVTPFPGAKQPQKKVSSKAA